jgi:ribosomal protein S18 acetylase RimI-like enzyme
MDCFTYKDAEQKIVGLMEHVSNGSAMVYGVFDNEDLVGYVWAYEHPFREEIRVYVNEIHVDEAYRNRGVGKQLLSTVESMARSKGYGALYIHAEGNNEGAIRLYQNEGYEIERVQLRKVL